MALKTRKSAMSSKQSAAEFSHHGCDTDENFLNSPDSVVTTTKSQSALISLDVNAECDGADVTLLSNDNSNHPHAEKLDRCRIDCKTLRRTALRKKYPSEEIAHHNMLARSKPHVSVRFRKFADFLFEVGPKPFPRATLDRIDNSDPEYAPGKVRWADAHTQSNNRSTSRLFDDPDGNQYTVAELAKRQDISPNAIHQRLRRGWSYAQIVAGDRSSPKANSTSGPTSAATGQPEKKPTIFVLIPDLKPVWLEAMDAAYKGAWHNLSGREKKGLQEIAERCASGGLSLYEEDVVRYAIKNWSRLTARAKSREGAYGMPDRPTVDFLQKFIRVAVNLYLEDKGFEFKNSAVRPREKLFAPIETLKECKQPQLSGPAPIPEPTFRDVPYNPPGFIWDPNDWHERGAARIENDFAGYAKHRLEPYNTEYTAITGKLPPEACRCPSNLEAYFSFFYPPGWDDDAD
jgi:hypothetical protein